MHERCSRQGGRTDGGDTVLVVFSSPRFTRRLPESNPTLTARAVIVTIVLSTVAASCGDADTATESPASTTTIGAPTTTEQTPTTTEATTTTAQPPTACSVYDQDGRFVFTDVRTEPEILEMLGEGWTSTVANDPLIDFEALGFACGGETIFYGDLGPGGTGPIDVFTSWHPSIVDPAGVGPGMSIDDASSRRGGSALASIDRDVGAREIISFADDGARGWSYRGGSESNGTAGIYADQSSSQWVTDVFAADAEITSVRWNPSIAELPEPDLQPRELGYPAVGMITRLEQGDLSCYATIAPVPSRLGQIQPGPEIIVPADFGLCSRTDLLTPDGLDVYAADPLDLSRLPIGVAMAYRIVTVSDCESAEPCDALRNDWLLTGVVELGPNWTVNVNDTYLIARSSFDTPNPALVACFIGDGVDPLACDIVVSDIVVGDIVVGDTVTECADDANDCRRSWQDGNKTFTIITTDVSGEVGYDAIETVLEISVSGSVTFTSDDLSLIFPAVG